MATQKIRPDIKLKSPFGTNFTALWFGDRRSLNRRVMLISYVGINGQVADDYGADGVRYPIDIRFEGPDFETKVDEFFKACNEPGKWEVIHPTKGFLGLQLLSVTENIQPVKDANGVNLSLSFVEYIDPKKMLTAAQLKQLFGVKTNEFNLKQASKISNMSLKKFSDRKTFLDYAESISDKIDKFLKPIASVNKKISQTIQEIQQGIQTLIFAGAIKPLSLISMIQQTAQMPMLAIRDIKTRLQLVKALARDIMNNGDNPIDIISGKTLQIKAVLDETVLSSMLLNMGTISLTSTLQTKDEAVNLIEETSSLQDDVNEYLDNIQLQLGDEPIEDQYLNLEDVNNDLQYLIDLVSSYLLTSSLDLQVARFITLPEDTTVFSVVSQYYPEGDFETNLNKFIKDNNIQGDEFFILPAQKTVVIYG